MEVVLATVCLGGQELRGAGERQGHIQENTQPLVFLLPWRVQRLSGSQGLATLMS